jgi:hypothetical protein
MWVNRLHYESLFENLTIERAKNSIAEARLAAMQATQDWLTLHVNRLENERRILTEARLGLVFPAPEISRSPERASPSSFETPPDSTEGQRMDPDVIRGVPHDSLPIAQLMAASLEDVGDDQAAELGVSHDAHGFAVYRR